MLVLKMGLSLDGFVGGPNGEIDWLFASMDKAAAAWTVERLLRADVHIMGSRTFRDMAAWWPTASGPFAAPMNDRPKVAFSRSGAMTTTTALRDATRSRDARGESKTAKPWNESWTSAEIVRGELTDEIPLLRQRYRTVLAHGGARFAQNLVASGLVDEYWLLIHPVALGRGLPLFSALREPLPLQRIESQNFPSGTTAFVYRPA